MASDSETDVWDDEAWRESKKRAKKIREIYTLYETTDEEQIIMHNGRLQWELTEPIEGKKGTIHNSVASIHGHGYTHTPNKWIQFRINAVRWDELDPQEQTYLKQRTHPRITTTHLHNMILLYYYEPETGRKFIGTPKQLFDYINERFDDTYGVEHSMIPYHDVP